MHENEGTFLHSAHIIGTCSRAPICSTTRKWFTPDEDKIILESITSSKKKNWKQIAEKIPGRNARQCRDRYNNSLKNKIEKKPWTKEEDEIIIRKFFEIGPKWVTISAFLNGRSGNNVKNRWHKYINKDRIFRMPSAPRSHSESGPCAIAAPPPLCPAAAPAPKSQDSRKKSAKFADVSRNEGKEKECLQTLAFIGSDDSFKQPVNLGNDDNPDSILNNDENDMFYGFMTNENTLDFFCLGKMDPF